MPLKRKQSKSKQVSDSLKEPAGSLSSFHIPKKPKKSKTVNEDTYDVSTDDDKPLSQCIQTESQINTKTEKLLSSEVQSRRSNKKSNESPPADDANDLPPKDGSSKAKSKDRTSRRSKAPEDEVLKNTDSSLVTSSATNKKQRGRRPLRNSDVDDTCQTEESPNRTKEKSTKSNTKKEKLHELKDRPSKKRGRKSIHVKSESDDEEPEKSNNVSKGKRKAGEKKFSTSKNEKDGKEENKILQCKHCDFTEENFTKMKFHYASAHILLYSKSTPEGTDDLKSLKKVSTLLGGKLTCSNCKKAIRTPAYYKQHVQLCKSDRDAKVRCELCLKNVSAFWKHLHDVSCKKRLEMLEAQQTEEKEKPKEQKSSSSTSRKRKAAAKARRVIKDLTGEKEEVNLKDMYSTPQMTVPSEEVVEQWTRDAEKGEVLYCTHEGCDVHLKDITDITQHYWTCTHNGLNSHTWNCKRCPEKFSCENEALSHVKSHKEKKRRRRNEDEEYRSDGQLESDDDMSSGDPTEDEAGSVSETDEEEDTTGRRKHSGRECKGNPYLSYDFPYTFPKYNVCKSRHMSEKLTLPKLLPTKECLSYKKVEAQEITHTSPSFTLNSSAEVQSLKFCEVTSHDDGFLSYIGKPVKMISWCPLPSSSKDLFNDEFFAVVLDSEGAEANSTQPSSCPPSSLSIWKVQNLNESKKQIKVDLSMNLIHSYGRINQMRWAYDGGFIPSPQGQMGRLGLLALACSDGSVHVASVPVMAPKKLSDGVADYSLVQSLNLSVNGNTDECTSVDWQRQDTKMVVAGFADGSVAIWYVGGEVSSYTLQPIKVFKTPDSIVTAVRWCPFLPDLFATFCHGWYVWDIKDLSSPYFTPKTMDCSIDLHTKAVWPTLYHVVISCTDPSFGCPPLTLSTLGYELIQANQKAPIMGLVCSLDLDLCDCSNTLVVCDSSGTVGMHNPIVPKYIKKADRELTHHMALSSKSSTLDDTGKLWDFQYMNKTHIRQSDVKAGITSESTKLLMTNNQEAAINTVSLNPNKRSHGWLLCGGTHGLLHFIKVT